MDTSSRAFPTERHRPLTVRPVFDQEMTALAGEPLPVEFCHGGDWHPGVLLGWRHEWNGSCQVRVQFVVGGLRRTSWMELVDVRLPEPEPIVWAPAPRRSTEPRTRPDLLLPDRDRSRPLSSAVPPPRSHDDDLTWV
jgi:hypothetical protein